MNTSPITPDLLRGSVIAVPPLCRDAGLEFHPSENQKLIRHIESGGVTTILFGGNANFYHVAPSEYPKIIDWLPRITADSTTVIPSIGPSFGLAMDQAKVLSRTEYPTAMLLPTLFPAHPEGIEECVRRCVDVMEKPIVLYLKDASYLPPSSVARLVDEQRVGFVKYAIVRDSASDDPYLTELIERVDSRIIVSGIGEQPAIVHLNEFKLQGFTSGCVCIAPAASQRMLQAIARGDWNSADSLRAFFEPLEDLRNTHGPIPVLHHAVAGTGIAETGPLLPLLADLSRDVRQTIADTARALLQDQPL